MKKRARASLQRDWLATSGGGAEAVTRSSLVAILFPARMEEKDCNSLAIPAQRCAPKLTTR
jgi:hypothetical protein